MNDIPPTSPTFCAEGRHVMGLLRDASGHYTLVYCDSPGRRRTVQNPRFTAFAFCPRCGHDNAREQ